MKILLLVAAFGVAGLVSAKSTITKENVKKKTEVKTKKIFELCAVSVTYYDSDGNVTGFNMFTSDQSSLLNCQMWQDLVKYRLTKQGFTLTNQGAVKPSQNQN